MLKTALKSLISDQNHHYFDSLRVYNQVLDSYMTQWPNESDAFMTQNLENQSRILLHNAI